MRFGGEDDVETEEVEEGGTGNVHLLKVTTYYSRLSTRKSFVNPGGNPIKLKTL